MRTLLLALLMLPSCSEFGLTPSTDLRSGSDSDDGQGGVRPARGPELCNGLDDDGDGDVDEGFADVDGDGIADCRDEDCEVASLDESATDQDPSCLADWRIVQDPWNLVVEWHWGGSPSVAMPAVANLTDDDGDGDIDAEDVPDIAIVTYDTGDIVVLSGDTGRELWRAVGFRPDSGVAVADVDADGSPEVIGVTRDNRVRALRANGDIAWTSAEDFPLLYPIPTVADLDQDGQPEVIADVAVLRGIDGSTYAELDPGQTLWRAPAVADLDRDGRPEILLGNRVFDHTGALLWSAPTPDGALSAFPAVVQSDLDAEAEVVWAVGSTLQFLEHDGTVTASQPLSRRGRPGPPCAGDLDADGASEVIVPASDALSAFDDDGTPLWSVPIQDSSGSAGCVVFDMDGDAVFEVIYADMYHLMVIDGASGAVRYRNEAHGSVTYFETPVVADVDADGSAEIIVVSSGSRPHIGVTVFGHADDGWPPSGPAWPVHDYYVSNVTDGGSVPVGGEPGWSSHLLFRGRPATPTSGLPDLAVSIIDACVASCEPGGLLRLAWQVRNEGQRDVPAGSTVALDLVDGKNRTRLKSRPLPQVPAGTALPSETFDLPWNLVPQQGLQVVVDPEGRLIECDEDDNIAEWHPGLCRG